MVQAAGDGTIKEERIGKLEMFKTSIGKAEAKPTKVKQHVYYHKLDKRGESDIEPESTPVDETEDGPDECPCGNCGRGTKTTAAASIK